MLIDSEWIIPRKWELKGRGQHALPSCLRGAAVALLGAVGRGCDFAEPAPLPSAAQAHPSWALAVDSSSAEKSRGPHRPLFLLLPSNPGLLFTAVWALRVSCDVWHSCSRACGKKQYWVCARGGRAQGDQRESWGGREAQAGRETRRGWGLSLLPRSPLISRPRIEPPINKSKSYLNTLPPPPARTMGFRYQTPLIIALGGFQRPGAHQQFFPPSFTELRFLESFHVFTYSTITNRSFVFLAYYGHYIRVNIINNKNRNSELLCPHVKLMLSFLQRQWELERLI